MTLLTKGPAWSVETSGNPKTARTIWDQGCSHGTTFGTVPIFLVSVEGFVAVHKQPSWQSSVLFRHLDHTLVGFCEGHWPILDGILAVPLFDVSKTRPSVLHISGMGGGGGGCDGAGGDGGDTGGRKWWLLLQVMFG